MMKTSTFIIDFDSTFTKVEALDILADIVGNGSSELTDQISAITDLAMEGKLSFEESLSQRLQLIRAHKTDLDKLVSILQEKISDSFKRNQEFLDTNKDDIIIVSNGFKEFICPVIKHAGLNAKQVYANTFTFDDEGYISGYDKNNILSKSGGKPKLIAQLNLTGEIFVIGDGYNDYEIYQSGMSSRFFAFTENVERLAVTDKADDISPNLDDVLFELNMKRAHSYPKNRIKALLLEGVHPDAKAVFEEEGYQVEYEYSALGEEELIERIKDVNILGVRSKTQVTAKVMEAAKRLIAVGAYCIGTNQIDLDTAANNGIVVFNAPYSNTRSVVELAIAEIILLIRNLPDKIAAMHNGKWEKSAAGSKEIRGKRLGILGYGNIGSQLSVIAEALGMQVYYYDILDKLPLGNAVRCATLTELYSNSDVLSIHIDGRASNHNLITAKDFEQMNDGVIFLNLARGKVVDLEALKSAIDSGKVGGCSIDVFPSEPKSNDEVFNSILRNSRNTILTPHIGGSTEEAQKNIGNFVPNKIVDYINNGNSYGSVNLPNVQLPVLDNAHRLLHIHRNEPNVLAQINQILAEKGANIVGQYLKTNDSVGYLITDIDKAYGDELIKELRSIEATIWFRVLY